jgi:hypothetical protein
MNDETQCEERWIHGYKYRTFLTHRICGCRVEVRSNTEMSADLIADAESACCPWHSIPEKQRAQVGHAHALEPDGTLATIRRCNDEPLPTVVDFARWDAELAIADEE